MKRKGLLKKIVATLCAAGILIGMPVTANAADQKDILGEWYGPFPCNPIIFYENGIAHDFFNDKPYKMESGSITVTYSTGTTETVDYDFWRGNSKMEDVPVDDYEDAVIFKIIGPGQIRYQNIWKEEGESGWYSYAQSILTKATEEKKTEDKKEDTVSVGPVIKCEHHYEWTVTTEPTETADGVSSYICTSCGDVKEKQPISASSVIRNNLLASIKNAEAGTTVTFDNQAWLCYPQYVLDALKEKGDVSLKTDFTYKGVSYSFIIPAGSDYTNLEQADFYGFMYLFGAFDGTIVN